MKTFRVLMAAVLIVSVFSLGFGFRTASATPPVDVCPDLPGNQDDPSECDQPGFDPVTLCHASPTGAGGSGPANSYELITVDNEGALNGHLGHPNDLIPAPDGGCPVVGDDDDGDDDVEVCEYNPQLPADDPLCVPPGDDDDDEACRYNPQLPADDPLCVPPGDDDDPDYYIACNPLTGETVQVMAGNPWPTLPDGTPYGEGNNCTPPVQVPTPPDTGAADFLPLLAKIVAGTLAGGSSLALGGSFLFARKREDA